MWRIAKLCLLGVVVSLCASSVAWAAKAVGHKRKSQPPVALVFHPRFHRVATNVADFVTDRRYVVIAQQNTTALIDDQTGKRMALTFPSQCGFGVDVGGGRVLTSCVGLSNPPYELYSIRAGAWTPVTAAPDAFGEVALGADWIEYYHQTPATCAEHCAYEYAFGNIATGQTRTLPAWKPGGTTIPDLNSPALSAKLCSPLRVPQGFGTDATPPSLAPDPLTFAGPFAIGEEWFVRHGLRELRLLLERCGSRLHQALTSQISSSSNQFAINRHAVIWVNSQGGPVHGLFWPSLRKFTMKRAPAVAGPVRVFLTSRTLYLESGDGRVIATAAPSPPKP